MWDTRRQIAVHEMGCGTERHCNENRSEDRREAGETDGHDCPEPRKDGREPYRHFFTMPEVSHLCRSFPNDIRRVCHQ